jgi:hypothetical protein
MKPEIIPSPPIGLYVLTKDVDNPDGDLRVKHRYWRRSRWAKGQKFVVEVWEPEVSPDLVVLRPAGGYDFLAFLKPNEAKLGLVVPHLEPLPLDTLAHVMLLVRESGLGPESIIRILHAEEKLTLDDLKDVVCRHTNKKR